MRYLTRSWFRRDGSSPRTTNKLGQSPSSEWCGLSTPVESSVACSGVGSSQRRNTDGLCEGSDSLAVCLMRQLMPLRAMTSAWWTMRSIIAEAVVASPKTWPSGRTAG
jgi:hypothetical protein